MMTSLLTVPLGLLLLSTSVLSEINIELNYDHDLKDSLGKKYEVRGYFHLTCKLKSNEKDLSVVWKKEDQDVGSVAQFKDRFTDTSDGNTYSFKVTKAIEDDAGTYYCVVSRKGEELKRANITLFSRYRVKTPSSVNSVEGETLRIHCIVYGKPTPTISWKFENYTYTQSTDRVELKKDVERDVDNAILEIKEVTMEDRGVYTCTGEPEVGDIVEHSTMVRIKDKYAALWPFLGICAEVFILCAIILIYEKKRNKTELEESDTDQSPDQKQTPDHGKESNLRHRQ